MRGKFLTEDCGDLEWKASLIFPGLANEPGEGQRTNGAAGSRPGFARASTMPMNLLRYARTQDTQRETNE